MVEVAVDPRHAADPLVLSVDVGTSSTRALVYDAGARQVRGWEFHRPYELTTTSDGGAFVDPDFLFHLTVQTIDAVYEAVGKAGRRVAAVACDTFWHSLMGLDAVGKPTTSLLTWADTRSRVQAEDLRQRENAWALYQRTGAPPHPSYWPAKLMWLRASSPETVRRTGWWISFGEYLYLRFFGIRRVSVSMASGTGLFLQGQCAWDEDFMRTVGVNPEAFFPVADLDDAGRGLVSEVAGRWPKLADVPWFLPVGDGACNNLGSGGFEGGPAVLMVGTSGALRNITAEPYGGTPQGLWTYRVDRRRLIQGGALSSGGNIHAWLEGTLSLPEDAAVRRELMTMAPDSHGLTVLPFLAGERSPGWWPGATGTVTGLRLDTDAVEITRAFLEAIAYRFRAVWEIIGRDSRLSSEIIGSGGALMRSPEWTRIICDVLGTPIILSSVPEATTRGGALLALEALGAIRSARDIPAPSGPKYAPVAKHAVIYQRAINRQREFLAAVRAWDERGMDAPEGPRTR